MRVYFDNAATTPLCEEAIETMTTLMRAYHGNPSSIHACGRKVRSSIEQARKNIANLIGASIGEIFFTSGGTEANNMALNCSVRDLGVTRIITSPIEHHCILHCTDKLEDQGVEVVLVNIDKKGHFDYDHLESLLVDKRKKTLVSLMHANNEIGTVSDMQRISQLCELYEAYYHSDTVQTIGHFPIDVSKTKISFLSGGAHKFHGPKGVGFVYINGDNMVKPMIFGGGQERNMRAGTENVYGIAGMSKALELACGEMEERRKHINDIRSYLKNSLSENFEDIQFNGDADGAFLYTVLSVSFPPSDKSDMLLLNLDIHGISCSGGSACSSGAEAGSHVQKALESDPKRKNIRFSFSHFNTKAEVDYLMEKLATIIPAHVERV